MQKQETPASFQVVPLQQMRPRHPEVGRHHVGLAGGPLLRHLRQLAALVGSGSQSDDPGVDPVRLARTCQGPSYETRGSTSLEDFLVVDPGAAVANQVALDRSSQYVHVGPSHQRDPCLPQGPLRDEVGAYSKYSCLKG